MSNFEQLPSTLGVENGILIANPQSVVLLCIDNDEDMLECERLFLESFGYTVLTAPSGGKGLELASKHLVDVVIVDYFMPEMNGHEVAIEMRRLRPQAPIILLTEAVSIPVQTLNLVDVLVPKTRLGSHLLPAIVQLQGNGCVRPVSYDA